MEIGFNERLLKESLSKLDFWKQLLFLANICERMLPNFEAFSEEASYDGNTKLSYFLEKALMKIEQGDLNADFTVEADEAESIAPHTEEYDSLYVSSALDAAISISLLMKAFKLIFRISPIDKRSQHV